MIMTCKCENEYQDKIHGKGRRVFNEMKEKPKHRCTSCRDIKSGESKKEK